MTKPLSNYVAREQVISRSVLERLLDNEPDRTADPLSSISTQVRELREVIRRDIEALLNTRRCPVSPSVHLRELVNSVFTYGVDGFMSANLVTEKAKTTLARKLEHCIAQTETRLTDIRITILKDHVEGQRTLNMRIEAILPLQEVMQTIQFETRLDPSSQRFVIEAQYE